MGKLPSIANKGENILNVLVAERAFYDDRCIKQLAIKSNFSCRNWLN